MVGEDFKGFFGKYRFLSNFTPTDVSLDGVIYPTVEHAYQAAKTIDVNLRKMILSAKTPALAKRLGRAVTIREDWDTVKLIVMQDLCRQKFQGSEQLKSLLLDTGELELIEYNTWKDTYWGVCNGVGENNLGKILMGIRESFR